jgi:hypothetical protein
MFRWFTLCGALIAASGFANAQTASRRAALIGGGSPNGGKCTVEVMVDSSAEVEVRGDTATLRNTGGQTPQWRRFECTSAMPANPVEFRFAGVDGRGRQTLIRDPRNSAGTAVVRIEDSDSGAEGYTFDLFWGNYSAPISQDRNGRRPDEFQQGSAGRPVDRQDRGFDRQGDFRGEPRLNAERTIQSCRESRSTTILAARIGLPANWRFRGGSAGRIYTDSRARWICAAAWFAAPTSTNSSGVSIPRDGNFRGTRGPQIILRSTHDHT